MERKYHITGQREMEVPTGYPLKHHTREKRRSPYHMIPEYHTLPRSPYPIHQTSFTRTQRVSEFPHTPHESYLYGGGNS